MKFFFALPLLIICMAANSQELEKIDIDAKWYATYYSIGEKESGFWGPTKEYKKIKAAIKTNPKANEHLKKSNLFRYAGLLVLAAYMAAYDTEEGDSFDEDTFFAAFPLIVGLGYGQTHFLKKAVQEYNVGVASKISFGPSKSFIELTYRF